VDLHAATGKPALEVVMTTLHAGGKFDNASYKVSGGLHGVGVSCVNALAETCAVEVLRDGKLYTQDYVRGVPTAPMKTRAADKKAQGSGTTVRFKPDAQIFETTDFHWDTIARACASWRSNSGSRSTSRDERTSKAVDYFAKGGIAEFVKFLNTNKETLHAKPVVSTRERDNVSVRWRQYNDTYGETLLSFVNNINTIEAGTHVGGFRSALTRTLVNYANREGHTKNLKADIGGEDVREGWSRSFDQDAEPAVRGADQDQARQRDQGARSDRGRRGPARALRGEPVGRAQDRREDDRRGARPRGGAQGATCAAQDHPRRRLAAGKLADCAWDNPEECELYIVEGDSAAARRSRAATAACGHPADPRQDPERGEGAHRQDPRQRGDPQHRSRRWARVKRSSTSSSATTASSSWPMPTWTARTSARCC
jgi:DNA gyrase subunit B